MADRLREHRRIDRGLHPFVAAAEEFLSKPSTEREARRILRRRGLNLPDHEVTSEALRRVWVRMERNPEGLEGANVEAYCTDVMKKVVSDAARGLSKTVEFDEEYDAPGGVRSSEPVAPSQLDTPSTTVADELRAAIECDDSIPPWVAASALNYVALTLHPDIDLSGAPRPEAGARPDQARYWPSLWFAGQRKGLFPNPSDNPAQRKRRSRAARQVSDAFQSAAAHARLTGAAHG